jgi:large subunit ribosomal protein L20
MPRSKNRVASRARRKKVLKRARGFYGRRKSNLKLAYEAVAHAGQYAYAHRKDKKGDFRRLWITRINAGARILGVSYSVLINKLNKANITLNRKILADLAMNDAEAFKRVVAIAQAA